jgi:ABC-type dipeptide/oligopeptide/nickel transport system ATPase subunit
MDIRFHLCTVGKTFRNHRPGRNAAVAALVAVDLDIRERQVNVLVGRSGAGKSTLARILMGFEAPDSGEVLYRGRPLSQAPRPDFCRRNQMVFQNPYLAVNPLFSVQQIISEPLRILKIPDEWVLKIPDEGVLKIPDGGGAAAGARRPGEKIAEVLDLLELPVEYLQRLPHELSGGELQRVALARALVLEPEFLVLDEPFSALDDLTAMRILLQFKRIFLRLRLGILFISHHPRHVRALADRVAVLEKGRILVPTSG